MRKLISGAMTIAAIGALTAPVYAADATESGAVKVAEQPSTAATPHLKVTTASPHLKITTADRLKIASSDKNATAAGLKIDSSSKSKMTNTDHKDAQAIPKKSDYLKIK